MERFIGMLQSTRLLLIPRSFAFFLVLLAAIGQVKASEPASSEAKIVSLAYDFSQGVLYKASQNSLFQSLDDGQKWQEIKLPSVIDNSDQVVSMVTPAGGNNTLYLAGRDRGIFKSENSGESWTVAGKGLPATQIVSLAAHATLAETLYVVMADKNIYRSEDAGRNWQLMDEGPGEMRLLKHTNMKGSMKTGWLYAVTANDVQRAMDCFCLWRQAGDFQGKITDLVYNPQIPEHIYIATENGLLSSQDGGETWKQRMSPERHLTTLVYTTKGIIFGTTSDGTLFSSQDDAETWERRGD